MPPVLPLLFLGCKKSHKIGGVRTRDSEKRRTSPGCFEYIYLYISIWINACIYNIFINTTIYIICTLHMYYFLSSFLSFQGVFFLHFIRFDLTSWGGLQNGIGHVVVHLGFVRRELRNSNKNLLSLVGFFLDDLSSTKDASDHRKTTIFSGIPLLLPPLLQGFGGSSKVFKEWNTSSMNPPNKHIKSEDFFMISGWCFQRSPICSS